MFSGDDSTRQSWMLVIVWSAAAVLVRSGHDRRTVPE
jgi:hypothetical protein